MWNHLPQTPVYEHVTQEIFDNIIKANRPAVLKNVVKEWSLVKLAQQSPEALCNQLKNFTRKNPQEIQQPQHKLVESWWGSPAMKGRFFYSDDIKGRNFEKKKLAFNDFLDQLIDANNTAEPPHIFAGAIDLHEHAPAVIEHIKAPFLDDSFKLTSLWIGNRTRTAAHWDLPQNLACVVAGKRRFITFPIEQIKNLYFGPIDNTLAGQSTSLVDFYNPDYERFPLFKEAMQHAEVAELDAGDAIYMPSMCIHHVESLENFGAMINFWWRIQSMYMTTPLLTLCHALTTLREMPASERESWQHIFDHYIFNYSSDKVEHIPESARGILGKLTPDIQNTINHIILQSLKD